MIDEPNWTYRDLVVAAEAEIASLKNAAFIPDDMTLFDALGRAQGVRKLWLRLTDETRNPTDLRRLDEAIAEIEHMAQRSEPGADGPALGASGTTG